MPETTLVQGLSPAIAALIKAKANFGAIEKDRTNPFHKSKYATLDSINKAVDGPLLEQGLVVVHRIEQIEGATFVVSRLLHESGEFDPSWQMSTCPIPNTTDSQKLGSAITYARRYNKLQLLDIVADEDDDGNASTKITTPQRNNLVSLGKKHGWTQEEMKQLVAAYGFESSYDLTMSAYASICEELKNKVVEKED